jgi:formylglycine-generating enzyme required for sulfatase activity
MKFTKILLKITLVFVVCFGKPVSGVCPSADLTGDCIVNLEDLAIMASQWMTGVTPPPILYGMTWVSINDDGLGMNDKNGNPINQGGFIGEMSKYETTNAQYCRFLNEAIATGDVVVSGNDVNGASGSNSGEDFAGQGYYDLAGSGYTTDGATDGGAVRINHSGGSFTVDPGFENHPVTHVSWYGATAFASYYSWRLPTEWEWQAVADYDGSYSYGCGATINNTIANYRGSTHPHGTTPVGQFGTYGYGMADMAGNVWEWTSTADGNSRRLRGGCWYSFVNSCTVSNWFDHSPSCQNGYYGFRVCR